MPVDAASPAARVASAARPMVSAHALCQDLRRAAPPPAAARREALRARRERALDLVHDAALLQPAASWRFVPLEAAPGADGVLALGGRQLAAPRLVPASGHLCALACAVLTLGDRIEQRIRDLFAARQAALAVALDAVANELLSALSRRVQDHMLAAARQQGLELAGELRAGDPGLALEAQDTVLQLAGAAQIGVTLSGTLMMHPAKTLSLVQGVGQGLPAVTWSRCDDCRSRARCSVGRAGR